MKLDLFQEFFIREGYGQADCFAEGFRQIDLAEEVGFNTIWLAELHFGANRSMLSSPIPIAGAIGARNKKVRVGLAVHIVGLHNPLRIAEEVATIDQIAEGRFDFGVGSARLARTFEAFGISFAEARGRFDECLEILAKAWTSDEFSYEGQYYTYHNVRVMPKPYQKPYPPPRLAVTTSDGYERAGRMGIPIFLGIRDTPVGQLPSLLGEYHRAWKGHIGVPDAILRIPVYCSETAEKASSDPEDSIMASFRRRAASFGSAEAAAGRADSAQPDASRADLVSSQEYTYDRVLKDHVVFGTPEALVERFQELEETLGVWSLIVEPNPGGNVPPDLVLSSMRLLGERVLPRFHQGE